jgi:hypothetical protein
MTAATGASWREYEAAHTRRRDAEHDVASHTSTALAAGRPLDRDPALQVKVEAWRNALEVEDRAWERYEAARAIARRWQRQGGAA